MYLIAGRGTQVKSKREGVSRRRDRLRMLILSASVTAVYPDVSDLSSPGPPHTNTACTSDMEPFPPGTTYPLKDWEREGKLNIELVGYGWWISVCLL